MNAPANPQLEVAHEHVFLGTGHEQNERKTWAVIWLCGAMMIVEIAGGSIFGSLALVADGLHMSTHASAMLIAALAYTYARKHAKDRRFVFGTGKLGDLAGFTSAIILAMIALLIGYEAVRRFLAPVPIHFSEALPIAGLGLVVNIVSAWLLSGSDHSHGHGHSHPHSHSHSHPDTAHHHATEVQQIPTSIGTLALSIVEEHGPAHFRIHGAVPGAGASSSITVTTRRTDGSRQLFTFLRGPGEFLESRESIPEPHSFEALVELGGDVHSVTFEEHAHPDEHDHAHPDEHDHADDHGHAHPRQDAHGGHAVDARDHNIRAAYVHVMADAAVSLLAIVGLLLAKTFGWLWMDPLAGIVGAFVIANWSYGLIRATGAILVDLSADEVVSSKIKSTVESAGDELIDLHVWRLGPGHLGAVISIVSSSPSHGAAFYHSLMRRFEGLSHLTVQVHQRA